MELKRRYSVRISDVVDAAIISYDELTTRETVRLVG